MVAVESFILRTTEIPLTNFQTQSTQSTQLTQLT